MRCFICYESGETTIMEKIEELKLNDGTTCIRYLCPKCKSIEGEII